MARKKKKKMRKFIVLVCMIALCVYGGIKGGEYAAQKLAKPINDGGSIFDGLTGGKTGEKYLISENEMVSLTAMVTEFVAAEHMKKSDRLAVLVDSDYYKTLLSNMKSLTAGNVSILDIEFKSIQKGRVEIGVAYMKNLKKGSETVTLESDSKAWKVIRVER